MSNLTDKLKSATNTKFILLVAALLASQILFSQSEPSNDIIPDTLKYEEFEMQEGDTTYVMKKYFLLTYLKGENRDQSEEKAQEIQKGHLAHMDTLAAENKICVAGPFGHDGPERGIIIFNAYSLEEADAMAKLDPAVVAGRLTYTLYPIWLAKGSTLD